MAYSLSVTDTLAVTTEDVFNATTAACLRPHEPQPIVTTYDYLRFVVEVVIVGFLCIFGFIGNCLCVVVLYRDHDRKNATNWLLQSLAVVDSIYLTTCFVWQTVACIYQYTNWIPSLTYTWPYIYTFIYAIASIAQTITVWMVLLVTIDRYVAICKPLDTHLRSIERAKIAVAVTVLLAILYNLPRFFERKTYTVTDPCTGETFARSNKTEFRNDKNYILIYKTIMYFVFRSIGPLLTLIILNIQLINALRLVHRKQKQMTKRTKSRENLTAMLVAVVTVFIVCEIPDTILRIVYAIVEYNDGVTIDVWLLRKANIFTNALMTLNSSVNFIIYCLIGKKFRSILAKMMCHQTFLASKMEVSETEPLTMRSTCNPNFTLQKNGGVDKDSNNAVNDVQL